MKEQIIAILNKHLVDLYLHGLRYGYETNTPLIDEIADEIMKVAEATKEMYPKEFIVWLVNIDNNPFGKVITGMHDALYVNFYEGSERKYTLDELSEYWKQNIRK